MVGIASAHLVENVIELALPDVAREVSHIQSAACTGALGLSWLCGGECGGGGGVGGRRHRFPLETCRTMETGDGVLYKPVCMS